MKLNRANIEHSCTELCEEIEKEYPQFTFICIAYQDDDLAKHITTKTKNILKHPAGESLAFELKNLKPKDSTAIECIGLSYGKKKSLFGLLSKTEILTGFLINANAFETLEEVKTELCGQIWKMLKLHDDIQNKDEARYRPQNNIFLPKTNGIEHAKSNMLSDVFAGSYMELSGRRNALKDLAKQRCERALGKTQNFIPKDHPFPTALDSTIMVFQDMNEENTKATPAKTARLIAQEIAETFDDNVIKRWQAFIESAQEMIWSGTSIPDTLGAAIYTSENAYNRSNAYLAAEIIKTQTTQMTGFEGYNPFSDIEIQERQHMKRCEERFQPLMSQIALSANADQFLKIAHQQCLDLLHGNPVGWDAPALAAAGFAYTNKKDEKDEAASPLEKASQAYRDSTQIFQWKNVKNLHRALIQHQRRGKTPTLNTIIEILAQGENSREAAMTIKKLFDLFENNKSAQAQNTKA